MSAFLRDTVRLVAEQMAELSTLLDGTYDGFVERIDAGELTVEQAAADLGVFRSALADQYEAELRDQIRAQVPDAWPAERSA